MNAINNFIKNYLFDDLSTNKTCSILIKNMCDDFLNEHAIKIYTTNITLAIECVARLLIFWKNIFVIKEFQDILTPLYDKF